MNFTQIAELRQSCRRYHADRAVEQEKLDAILCAARLAPSACNGQPYHISICTGDVAKQVAKATEGLGINQFVEQAPVLLVISERPCVVLPGLESRLEENDWRSIDIGILAAYITAEATEQELGSCIVGSFDGQRIREICHLDAPARLVITIGYPADGVRLRAKRRKELSELCDVIQ